MRLLASVLRKASEVHVASKASKVYVALTRIKRMEQLRVEIHKSPPKYKQEKSPQAQKKTSCSSKKKTIMMKSKGIVFNFVLHA